MFLPEVRGHELVIRIAENGRSLTAHEGEAQRLIYSPTNGMVDPLDQLSIAPIARDAQFLEAELVLSPVRLAKELGLPRDLLALADQICKNGDLLAHDLDVERLDEVIDGADFVRP